MATSLLPEFPQPPPGLVEGRVREIASPLAEFASHRLNMAASRLSHSASESDSEAATPPAQTRTA